MPAKMDLLGDGVRAYSYNITMPRNIGGGAGLSLLSVRTVHAFLSHEKGAIAQTASEQARPPREMAASPEEDISEVNRPSLEKREYLERKAREPGQRIR